MKSAIKHFFQAFIFLLIVAAMLLLLSILFRPKNNTSDAGMHDWAAHGILSEKENSIDVLILGDSESICSFIPMQLWEQHGITSYCCGTAAQPLYYSQHFLEKAFETQSPKLVILETNNIYRYFSFIDLVVQRLDQIFPVFSYHDRWKSLNAKDLNFAVNYTYVEDSKGYYFSAKINAAKTDNYMKPSNELKEIPRKSRPYVESMRSFCEEHGAKFVLISTPSTVNWSMPCHNSIQKLSKELNIDYLDLNLLTKEIPIDWNHDTRDKGDHLNYFGAQKVTSYIGQYLADSKLFISHKNDPYYSHWNTALENHNKMISKAIPQ